MIDFYTWTTPNGRKVAIMLEETGLAYRLCPINIGKNEQFDPAFLAIAPNNKIPAIVDHSAGKGGLPIFESGAILIYLAEKTGLYLPSDPVGRARALEWTFWQAGGFGPMAAQLGYFAVKAQERSAIAIERFANEVERLLSVLERRLSTSSWLAGDDYSIADMMNYPWLCAVEAQTQPLMPEKLSFGPATCAWRDRMGQREAVRRGMAIP